MVGNYGVSDAFMEADEPHARAVVMREIAPSGSPELQGDWEKWLIEKGIPAITGIDTRALVRHIRDKGAMRGGIFPSSLGDATAREQINAEPPMKGMDFAKE